MTPQTCARCQLGLPRDRQKAGKRKHYLCDLADKREARERAHDLRVGRTYGLLPGEYLRLYEYQNGRCYICHRCTGKAKYLAVDHDHALGSKRASVRGLLCSFCNRMIGIGEDNPAFFERAAEYLRSPPARRVLL